jgi:hypothetical protein
MVFLLHIVIHANFYDNNVEMLESSKQRFYTLKKNLVSAIPAGLKCETRNTG